MADFEPDIPQHADKLLKFMRQIRIGRVWQQYQQIDIREGEQLAPAIAADRNQGKRRRHRKVLPHCFELAIDQQTMAPQQFGG